VVASSFFVRDDGVPAHHLHCAIVCRSFYLSSPPSVCKRQSLQVEFKTLDSVSFSPESSRRFPDREREHDLCKYVRQMAVSQTLLRESSAGSFLVLIGRDHRVLVLEDAGVRDAEGLPLAFAWLKNTIDYWFHPNQPFSAFLREFVEAVAPFSLKSAERKLQWDRDCNSDFSAWNFLFEMMDPVVSRLSELKQRSIEAFALGNNP
jgi:hypothetical protein